MGNKKINLTDELGNLKNDVDKLRCHTVDMVSKIADAGKSGVDSAVENTKKAAKNAGKAMEKNPTMTLAGAVGVGAVLGGLVKRLFFGKKRR